MNIVFAIINCKMLLKYLFLVTMISCESNANTFVIELIDVILTLLGKKVDINYIGLNVTNQIENYGYIAEEHEVITPDGYFLTIHRIRGRKNEVNPYKKKTVLFMQVGIFCSSACFVDQDSKRMLGYNLVDHGYDVWLGNTRGTTFSRKHVTLNPDTDKSYWEYSLTEIGIYDITTMIDYVLMKTNEDKLHYIGHSQGTTTFFIMASVKPEYNNKIKSMTAISPVLSLANLRTVTKRIFHVLETIAKLILGNDVPELFPRVIETTRFIKHYCSGFHKKMCQVILKMIRQCIVEKITVKDIRLISEHFPAGASVYQMKHFFQFRYSGKFRYYDYGVIENLKRYDKSDPPEYHITKITTPVCLISDHDDFLISEKDLEHTYRQLPNATEFIIHRKFGHSGFLWNVKATEAYLGYILKTIQRYD